MIWLLACIPVEENPDPKDTTPESLPQDTGLSAEEDDARVRALSGLPHGESPCQEAMVVRVTDVVDGDTFWSTREDGGGDVNVRMIGIDTPEIAHGGDAAECYGNEAWARSREGLLDKLVVLTFDAECQDIYERTLAYVFRDNTEEGFWERNLARNGFADTLTIAPNDSFESLFAEDVSNARREGLGLWSACN
jgi:micrococcal nuclease